MIKEMVEVKATWPAKDRLDAAELAWQERKITRKEWRDTVVAELMGRFDDEWELLEVRMVAARMLRGDYELMEMAMESLKEVVPLLIECLDRDEPTHKESPELKAKWRHMAAVMNRARRAAWILK